MQRRNIMLSLAAVLLTACLYYRGGFVLLPIAALPVLVHELSHILALHLLGQRITGFSLDGSGLCIRYDGTCTPAGHILAALAGPLGGADHPLENEGVRVLGHVDPGRGAGLDSPQHLLGAHHASGGVLQHLHPASLPGQAARLKKVNLRVCSIQPLHCIR